MNCKLCSCESFTSLAADRAAGVRVLQSLPACECGHPATLHVDGDCLASSERDGEMHVCKCTEYRPRKSGVNT
jgi:hypothetical protein